MLSGALRAGAGLNPQDFIDAEIRKLVKVKNKSKRRRLARQWRKWSVTLARPQR